MLFLLSRLGYRSCPWIEHKRITAELGRASKEKTCWWGPGATVWSRLQWCAAWSFLDWHWA